MSSGHDWRRVFEDALKNDKSTGQAAIETLLECIDRSAATTVVQLHDELRVATDAMSQSEASRASLRSACELFMRFISLVCVDQADLPFADVLVVFRQRGVDFVTRVAQSRALIARFALPFLRNRVRILTHSFSRVVLEALVHAQNSGCAMHIYTTESCPDGSGRAMHAALSARGIETTLVLDAAVGYLMESVDMVLVGAEGVMETGGIINKIGTLGIAICARSRHKALYVMVESIKFVPMYPLNQADVPDEFKYRTSTFNHGKDLAKEHPLVDYTPPQFISLLFTDLGILTPAAVGEELMKLYT